MDRSNNAVSNLASGAVMNQLPLIPELPANPTTADVVRVTIAAFRAYDACIMAAGQAFGIVEEDGWCHSESWQAIDYAIRDAALLGSANEPLSDEAVTTATESLRAIAKDFADDNEVRP